MEYTITRKNVFVQVSDLSVSDYLGIDAGIVMMTFQTQLKKSRKPTQTRIRFDLENLNDPSMMNAFFQATIGGRFASLDMLVDEYLELDPIVTEYSTRCSSIFHIFYNIHSNRTSSKQLQKTFLYFYLLLLQLVLCRVTAFKSGPVHRP